MFILFLCLLTAMLILAVSWKCYRICFYSPKQGRGSPYDPMKGPQFQAVEDILFQVISIMERYTWEGVSVTSEDGIPLRGRYYHFTDDAPVMILCHGYRGTALRDCCGGHALARKLGFNALVIHQRAHGESGGKTITFGIKERRDVARWAVYVRERFGPDTPVILFGLSMGAATVLMGSSGDYPGNVRGIIADSPYSSPADIIRKVCHDMGYPAIAYHLAALGAILFGGFRPGSWSAMEAVCRSQIPMLLIHGKEDLLVPCDMSRRIASACPDHCHVLTIPDAGHGLGYMTDPAAYEDAVISFLRSIPEVAAFLDRNEKIK